MINPIKILKNITDQIYNQTIFLIRGVQYKKRPKINGKLYLVSDRGAITFGENVEINSSLYSNPIGGATRTVLFARPDGRISIGNHVGISNSTFFAAMDIRVEDDVLIGGDCRIYDTDFHSLNYEWRMETPDTHVHSAPVRIGRGAFIGASSIILKGVTIGEKSIVAAGSVVTKSIPVGEIWGGVPARFIRKV